MRNLHPHPDSSRALSHLSIKGSVCAECFWERWYMLLSNFAADQQHLQSRSPLR